MTTRLLDCTLRDGGYHNAWDFAPELVHDYLVAMRALAVDHVELGFRFRGANGYKGPFAYTTDRYVESLEVPAGLSLGVMVNAAELFGDGGVAAVLGELFQPAERSPVELVRLACHLHEVEPSLAAVDWLHRQGYRVGLNLMQVSERTAEELAAVARTVSASQLDVLYVADSLGSLTPGQVADVVGALRTGWSGDLGIHTHDNLGNALANSLRAAEEGVTWIDGTVTGMGRGAGNAKTEYLAVELAELRGLGNVAPLLGLIERHFEPLRQRHGWGTNFYYYLAGKYGIHPTYIQQMLADRRYSSEDLHAVIESLREGDGRGRRYSAGHLEAARNFFVGEPRGGWRPEERIGDREVLVLATGPGVAAHRAALVQYVEAAKPLVVALNTQQALPSHLVDLRAACHPMRLLADCERHLAFEQPLVTPASMLPAGLRTALAGKELLDYGLAVEPGTFHFGATHSVIPAPLVMAYVLAICAAGRARRVLLAGFDGYEPGDPRNEESESVFGAYAAAGDVPELVAVTPSRYRGVSSVSIYHLLG